MSKEIRYIVAAAFGLAGAAGVFVSAFKLGVFLDQQWDEAFHVIQDRYTMHGVAVLVTALGGVAALVVGWLILAAFLDSRTEQ